MKKVEKKKVLANGQWRLPAILGVGILVILIWGLISENA